MNSYQKKMKDIEITRRLEMVKSTMKYHPDDRKYVIAYRKMCIDLGVPERAMFEVGDVVFVEVSPDAGWIMPWKGDVVKITQDYLVVKPQNNHITVKKGYEWDREVGILLEKKQVRLLVPAHG